MKRPNLNRHGSQSNKNSNFHAQVKHDDISSKNSSATNSDETKDDFGLKQSFKTRFGTVKNNINKENSKENKSTVSSRFKYLSNKINPLKELKDKDYNNVSTNSSQPKSSFLDKNHTSNTSHSSHLGQENNLNNANLKAPKIEKERFIKSIRKINRPQEKETPSENIRISAEKRERQRKIQNNSSSPRDMKSTRRFTGLRETSFKVTQKGSSNTMLTVVAIFLVVGACLVFMAPTIKAWIVQSQEYNRIENQIAQTNKQNQELKDKLKKLNESSYVADQARQRLGYVKKGETTYVVVDPQTITKQKEQENVNVKAPRKPWFSLIKDSVKAVEETKRTKTGVVTKTKDTKKQTQQDTTNKKSTEQNKNSQNTKEKKQ